MLGIVVIGKRTADVITPISISTTGKAIIIADQKPSLQAKLSI